MMRKIGFTVFHSHSTVLEVMLLLGAIGLRCSSWCTCPQCRGRSKLDHDSALALGAPDPRRAVRALAVGSGAFGPWLPLMAAICAHGASETSDPRRQSGAGAEVGPRSRARPPLVVAVARRPPGVCAPSCAIRNLMRKRLARTPPAGAFAHSVALSATHAQTSWAGRLPGAFAHPVALSATSCTIASRRRAVVAVSGSG